VYETIRDNICITNVSYTEFLQNLSKMSDDISKG